MIAHRRIGQLAILSLLGLAVVTSPARADLSKDCDSENDEVSIKACTQLIRQNPGNPTAYYNRGVSYQNLDRHQDALEDYNAAIKLNPKQADYFHNRATARDRLGDLDSAIDDFNMSLKLRPNDKSAMDARAWARARANKELKEALADLSVLIKTDAKRGTYVTTRSVVYFRLGQWKDAIADADTALKLYAENEAALHIRGLAKIAAGDDKGGKQDLAAASAIDADVANDFAKYGIR